MELTIFLSFDNIFVMVMKNKFKITFLCLCFLGMTIMAEANRLTELSKQLPAQINGWRKSAQTTLYTPKNLFKYIDGGAELYISYSFKHLLAQKYTKADLPGITVDVFDMGNSFNAFGVFSHSRETLDNSVGDDVESEYGGGLLTFWKGRYYVSVLAYPETEEKKKTVLTLGRQIAGWIKEKSEKPSLIARLPAENIIKESIRYFHHYVWLNSHFFISDQNILHIREDTEAVLAKYKEEGNRYFVLLICYPDKAKAENAHRSFLRNYLPDARKGIKQLEDGRWTGCKIDGPLLMIVLNAPDAGKVESLLKEEK
jgi:hypothetical protein